MPLGAICMATLNPEGIAGFMPAAVGMVICSVHFEQMEWQVEKPKYDDYMADRRRI